MLIKDASIKIDVPHEEGEWVKIRRLSWRELDKAREVQQTRAMQAMRAMGGDVLEALRSAERNTEAEQPPEQKWDRATVLHAGVVDWSYDDKVNADNIDRLDDITADWLFRRIVQQHDGTGDDEAKKKGTSPSTAH